MGWNSDKATCPVCGNACDEAIRLRYTDLPATDGGDYSMSIRLCRACGLVFNSTPPSPRQLENRYKNESCAEYGSSGYSLISPAVYERQCKRQKSLIDAAIGGRYGSVLEVGAATGFNLSLYAGLGRLGIEPSAANCSSARSRHGVEMFQGMASEYFGRERADARRFDLLFMSHVLEHAPDPLNFLRECAGPIRKYAFIEVPTFDYKLIDEPYGLFNEEHINYFTLESLERLMLAVGFSLMEAAMVFSRDYAKIASGFPSIMTLWERVADPGDVRIRERANPASGALLNYLEGSARELERIGRVIDGIPDTCGLTVWGIGHLAPLLLRNTSLGGKRIVRAYDSDPRKLGRPFAGHAIRPFDPGDFAASGEGGRADAVLVASRTAQASILSELRRHGLGQAAITLFED